MSEKLSSGMILPIAATVQELEPEDVLDVLRSLSHKVASPVVRECLHEACAEIAYLTSCEGTFEELLARECDLGWAPPAEENHEPERDAV
jgi:hypothetical protein